MLSKVRNRAHLKSQKGHNYGHPADRHGYVSASLLSNNVHGSEEQHRPDNVVENHQAEKRHEDPEGDTHHLMETAISQHCPNQQHDHGYNHRHLSIFPF